MLPALDNSAKVQTPDLSKIGNQNYTSTIMRYNNLTLPFPQLNTTAKTIVDAINELYARPIANHNVVNGGGSVVIANPLVGKDNVLGTSDDDYIVTNLDYFIQVYQGESAGLLYAVSIDGFIYDIENVSECDIDDLNNVNISGATEGQILQYNASKMVWQNVDSSTFIPSLEVLTDVDIDNPQSGQALIYDTESENWINGVVSTVGELNDLEDVNITHVVGGQVLKYDQVSDSWINADDSGVDELAELTDVNLSGVTGGQVLKYDSQSDKWINADDSSGISRLDELLDVDITNPTVNQVLTYNGEEWVNETGAGTWEGTQQEYDAILEKDPNIVYYITDAPAPTFAADAVTYNHSGTKLTATTVQSAIDEIVTTNIYWTDIVSTLPAGSTSLQLHNSAITANSTVNVFVDSAFYGIAPTSITVVPQYVTLGFDEQSQDMPVKVRIS